MPFGYPLGRIFLKVLVQPHRIAVGKKTTAVSKIVLIETNAIKNRVS